MTDDLRPDRVYRLDLGYVNAYLVDDGDVTLIDAGMPNAADDIRAEIDAAGYSVADIDRILVTHFDIDHVGALAHLECDAPIYALDPDASFLDGSRKSPLTNHKGLLQRVLDVWLTRPDRPVRRLDDGETIGGFSVAHTPGHTPGHAVYVHEALEVGFLGDMVRAENGRLETPGWVICYSTTENERSLREFVAREPPVDGVAMGHGRPIVEGGQEALSELAERLA